MIKETFKYMVINHKQSGQNTDFKQKQKTTALQTWVTLFYGITTVLSSFVSA